MPSSPRSPPFREPQGLLISRLLIPHAHPPYPEQRNHSHASKAPEPYPQVTSSLPTLRQPSSSVLQAALKPLSIFSSCKLMTWPPVHLAALLASSTAAATAASAPATTQANRSAHPSPSHSTRTVPCSRPSPSTAPTLIATPVSSSSRSSTDHTSPVAASSRPYLSSVVGTPVTAPSSRFSSSSMSPSQPIFTHQAFP